MVNNVPGAPIGCKSQTRSEYVCESRTRSDSQRSDAIVRPVAIAGGIAIRPEKIAQSARNREKVSMMGFSLEAQHLVVNAAKVS
jgi:hypothetical protein